MRLYRIVGIVMSQRWKNQINRLIYLSRTFSWLLDPRFHLSKYNQIPIYRPIFLIGNQGGGLTLLSRMLRRHPGIVSVTGNQMYWSGADEMQNVFGPILPRALTGIRYKAPPHPILTPPRSWSYASDELIESYRMTEQDATPEIACQLRRVIQYCVGRHGLSASEPTRFIDKSQVLTVRVSLVHELLKTHSPIFVLVTRNPYVACYRAAIGKAGDMRRYSSRLSFEKRLGLCAEHWSNAMAAALKDRDRLGCSMLIVQFEDLLRRPYENLERICKFAGLSFDDRMLPHDGDSVPLGSRYLDRWYPLRTDVNESYMSQLTPEIVDLIAVQCAALAEELGYKKPVF